MCFYDGHALHVSAEALQRAAACVGGVGGQGTGYVGKLDVIHRNRVRAADQCGHHCSARARERPDLAILPG